MKIVLDQYNSEIFGLKFGNITEYNNTISSSEIKKVINESNFDFLGIKISPNENLAFHSFQKAGFYVVDCLVTYEFDSKTTTLKDYIVSNKMKDIVSKDDVETLSKIASEVFIKDRFHSDPNINKKLADKYYSTWVKNSFNDSKIEHIVAETNGKPIGFIVYKIDDINDTATIILNAVDKNFFRKGVYSDMLYIVTTKLIKKVNKIFIGTQFDNIAAIRTWQKMGYKIIDTKYVLHYSK